MIVHITSQGAKIKRDGRHLVVRQEDAPDQPIFLHNTEQLALYGNVGLTQPAIALLLAENIDTVFLRSDGRYLGRLVAAEPKNAELRLRQFLLSNDWQARLPVARVIVQGKLLNMAALLQRVARARRTTALNLAVEKLKVLAADVAKVDALEILLGCEGRGAAIYFGVFNHAFIRDQGFDKRQRRPPKDPVNATLSFLYTLLGNRAHAAIHLAGLDPQPGFLHSLHYGRHALPLDLMEEFRPVVVDPLVISLFNLNVLSGTDFERCMIEGEGGETSDRDDSVKAVCADDLGLTVPEEKAEDETASASSSSSKAGLRFSPEAFQRIIKAFEQKLQAEFFHDGAERKMTYAEALLWQAKHLRSVIEGEASAYQPLRMP